MQLDIFEHGRDVMLRNDVVVALLRRDAPAVHVACERLAEAFPHDDYLPDLQTLASVAGPVAGEPVDDHHDLLCACRRLDEIIAPAARRALGDADGMRWLLPFWQDLARRSARLPFKAECEVQHAAPLWLRAGEWEAAAQAVATIASWRRIPLPLRWMAEAQLHLRGLQSTWPLLVELGWLAPSLLAQVAAVSPDPALPRWMEQFETEFEAGSGEADLAWWPAWLLTQQSSFGAHLAGRAPRPGAAGPSPRHRAAAQGAARPQSGTVRGLHQEAVKGSPALPRAPLLRDSGHERSPRGSVPPHG